MRTLGAGVEFMVYDGTEPTLYCYVDAVLANNEVRCIVINGRWSFIMDTTTGHAAWQSPSGVGQAVFNWVSLEGFPLPRGDYTKVMLYVRDSGLIPGKMPPFKVTLTLLQHRVKKQVRRFKGACAAFLNAWRYPEGKPVDWEAIDDDIPF